jgi:hypothetical protein
VARPIKKTTGPKCEMSRSDSCGAILAIGH